MISASRSSRPRAKRNASGADVIPSFLLLKPDRADFKKYARVGALARKLGGRFVLDTSGPALKAAGRGIHLLKPSLRELEELAGHGIRGEAEEERAARALVAEGRSEIVLVSLGAAGALLATASGVERFPAITVATKSTIGAGDSMLASVMLALSRGTPLGEAVIGLFKTEVIRRRGPGRHPAGQPPGQAR